MAAWQSSRMETDKPRKTQRFAVLSMYTGMCIYIYVYMYYIYIYDICIYIKQRFYNINIMKYLYNIQNQTNISLRFKHAQAISCDSSLHLVTQQLLYSQILPVRKDAWSQSGLGLPPPLPSKTGDFIGAVPETHGALGPPRHHWVSLVHPLGPNMAKRI